MKSLHRSAGEQRRKVPASFPKDSIDVSNIDGRNLHGTMSAQDETSATMLHELRTPVQAIRGILEIVLAGRTGPLREVQRDFLSSANRAALRLERLISDFDVTKAQPGSLTLVLKQLSLHSSVEACLAEMRPMASDLGVEVTIEARSPENLGLLADPDRIDQILLNLLENALLYGVPEMPVRVHLRGGRTRVLCVIENTISRQNSEELFRPNADRRGEREQSCTLAQGLGLCVVQRLVKAHLGRVLTRITDDQIYIGFVLPRNVGLRPATLHSDRLYGDWLSDSLHLDP